MTLTDPTVVFALANSLALIGWLWLILWLYLPPAAQKKMQRLGLLLPLVLGLLYTATMSVHFSSAEGSFSTLNGVQSLFRSPGATVGGWIHYLSFDLFVGWVISRHATTRHISRCLLIPTLFFTFLLGPLGLLMYAGILIARWATHVETGRWAPFTRRVLNGNVVLAQCGVFLLVLLPALSLALLMDSRVILGMNIWIKPIKFSLALIVYTFTLSWYANHVRQDWRHAQWHQRFSRLVAVAILLEMLWLIYAASIGETSHFNTSHPLLTWIYPLMGLLAILLTSMSLLVGIGVLRNRESTLSPLGQFAMAYGLIATFFLTLLTAGYLSTAPAQSHTVAPTGMATMISAAKLPFLGWSRSFGDLRVAHFFATHALHSLPLLALAILYLRPQIRNCSTRIQRRIALGLTAIYCLIVLGTFVQALLGKPFV